MVVGVKEFGHVQSYGALSPTSHSEVQVIAGQLGETGWRQPQCEDPVENLIVQSSVQADLGNSCIMNTRTSPRARDKTSPRTRIRQQCIPYPTSLSLKLPRSLFGLIIDVQQVVQAQLLLPVAAEHL